MNNYERFGVMLDCSRNAVMKGCEVKKFIDCLVKWGITPWSCAPRIPTSFRESPPSGICGAEIREIDAYAKSKGGGAYPLRADLGAFYHPCQAWQIQRNCRL